jgi:hypothetical protein
MTNEVSKIAGNSRGMRGAECAAVMRLFNTSVSRRRWASWLVASVVVLGMGESKLIGLVTFEGFNSSIHAAFQNKRAEQKSPRDLHNPGQSATVREAFLGQARGVEPWGKGYVSAVVALTWPRTYFPSIQSDESPRAPPSSG